MSPGGGADPPIGVLLLNLGGPPDLTSVEPFLRGLFSDREIIQLPGGRVGQRALAWIIAKARGPKVRACYRAIGGGSPILPLTQRQATALERELNGAGSGAMTGAAAGPEPGPATVPLPTPAPRRFRVGIAMRYWRPSSEEALGELRRAGVRRVVALTLYPQYSAATTGSSLAELERASRRLGLSSGPEALRVTAIDRYPTDPAYVAALAGTVEEGLASLPREERAEAILLFSAHGLPVRFLERGDPYEKEIHATRAGVLAILQRRGWANPWRLGYQSRTGPVRWIGPSTDEVISKLGREGARAVVVVPLAFVSDHIETLYEIDQLFAHRARAAGIPRFLRARALNDDPRFIGALAAMVRAHLEGIAA